MLSDNPRDYALGVDIGGSHLSSAIVNLETGRILTPVETTPVDSMASATEIIEAWKHNICSTLEIFPIGVCGIGLAIPGPFDYTHGVSLISGVNKYERLFGLDLCNTLPGYIGELSHGSIRFVNDASAFALGECFGGAARGCGNVVAVTLGTGVGSGFISNGNLVVSGNTVPPNGWVYNLKYDDGIADDMFSTRWFVNAWKSVSGELVRGVKDIADMSDSNPLARNLFHAYGERLADFLLPLLKTFDSHTLLLGGNISKAYNLFGKSLEHTFREGGYQVDVKLSSLSDKAAIVGAASLFKIK